MLTMHFKMLTLILLALILLPTCQQLKPDDDDDDDSNDDPGTGEGVEVGELSGYDLATVKKFVTKNKYSKWTAEAEVHKATGNSPHGAARVFFNDTLVEALEADKTVMPKGSIVVKELYESDLETLKGYALDAKIKNGEGEDTWLFYEGLEPDFDNYYGVGISGCTGCHAKGTDYLRVSLPD